MDVDDDAVERRWEREQALLGLARDTPDEEFARGGPAILAVDPTVRITVIPGDPSAQRVPVESPEMVIPNVVTLPGGVQLPYRGTVRGTSCGYVGFTAGDGGRWQSFDAVLVIRQPNAEITVDERGSVRVSRPARDAGGWRGSPSSAAIYPAYTDREPVRLRVAARKD
jgi:hypothetical protein